MRGRLRSFIACRGGAVILLYALAVPLAAVASLKTVALAELVRKSDVIAFGHVRSATTAKQSNAAVLEITTRIKNQATRNSSLPLCNGNVDTEHPDLAHVTGDYVVFAAKKHRCYYLVWGWSSLIVVRNGQAHTSAIDDQPEEQSLEQFLGQIRSLAAAAERSTLESH